MKDIKQFIQECIDDRVSKGNGTVNDIDLFVDVKRRFVQINGVIYIPCNVNESMGIMNRVDVEVSGWEDLRESDFPVTIFNIRR